MSNIHAILKPFIPKKPQDPGADSSSPKTPNGSAPHSSASKLLNYPTPKFPGCVPAPLTPEALNHLITGTGFPSCPVILCIGTDRIIGDSLGPLVGSILKKKYTEAQNSCSTLHHPAHTLNVYGTLHHPAHALNLPDINAEIKKKHPNSPVIAVDASLGSYKHIGSVFVRPGSISPGSGVQKNLPPSGDIAITGIVNEESSHPYLALQTARLSTVADMAERIADCLLEVLLPTDPLCPPAHAAK